MGSQNFEQLMNLYHGIFTYCGIGALVFLVLAIVLFVLLKIPRVFCELTGRNAKKAIQEMVEEGSATGNLTSRKIGEDGRRHRKKGRTGALGTARLRRRAGSLTASLATEQMAAEVEPLAAPLLPPGRGDASDAAGGNETMVLGSDGGADFFVLRSIVEIHTDEVIG